MALLDLRQGRGLLKVRIRQPPLDLELGFDQVLPGFALLDMTDGDVQLLQQPFVHGCRED
jgi:hypothetical protein